MNVSNLIQEVTVQRTLTSTGTNFHSIYQLSQTESSLNSKLLLFFVKFDFSNNHINDFIVCDALRNLVAFGS